MTLQEQYERWVLREWRKQAPGALKWKVRFARRRTTLRAGPGAGQAVEMLFLVARDGRRFMPRGRNRKIEFLDVTEGW